VGDGIATDVGVDAVRAADNCVASAGSGVEATLGSMMVVLVGVGQGEAVAGARVEVSGAAAVRRPDVCIAWGLG
jgi:hypothetical protein